MVHSYALDQMRGFDGSSENDNSLSIFINTMIISWTYAASIFLKKLFNSVDRDEEHCGRKNFETE